MLKYVSSCASIHIWEQMCINAVETGYAQQVQNGRKSPDISCWSVVYHIRLKSSIYPAEIRFWYDTRINEDKSKFKRKDTASVKIRLIDMILLIRAIANHEINITLPEMFITRDKDDLIIEQR